MPYFFSIIKFCFIIIILISCSESQKDKKIIISEKDTSFKEKQISTYENKTLNNQTNETSLVVPKKLEDSTKKLEDSTKKLKDSIKKLEEIQKFTILEHKKVNEFKKTIYSRSIDLNFDKKKDLLLIYVIVTGNDTITYLSIYTQFKNLMKNTFDYRFEEKIEKIKDVSTFNDSTFVINAIISDQKKSIIKKFKLTDNYKFSLIY